MSCSFPFPIEIDLSDSQTVHVGAVDTIGEEPGAWVLEGVGDSTLLDESERLSASALLDEAEEVVVRALLGDTVIDAKALTERGPSFTSHKKQPTGHALSTMVALSRRCIGERILLVRFLRRLGAVLNCLCKSTTLSSTALANLTNSHVWSSGSPLNSKRGTARFVLRTFSKSLPKPPILELKFSSKVVRPSGTVPSAILCNQSRIVSDWP